MPHSRLEVWENVWLFSWSMILYFTLKKCMKLYVWNYIWLTDSWKIGKYETICMKLYILPARHIFILIHSWDIQSLVMAPCCKWQKRVRCPYLEPSLLWPTLLFTSRKAGQHVGSDYFKKKGTFGENVQKWFQNDFKMISKRFQKNFRTKN